LSDLTETAFGAAMIKHSRHILLGMLIFFGLYISSLYNYLLFHSISEIFSIVIAFIIFTIVWNSRKLLSNNYLAFLGIAFLFIGCMDFIHTMSYKGIAIFEGFGTNLPTQLWISARYIQSLSFLIAPLFFRRSLNIKFVFLLYTIVLSILLMSIFVWGIFPFCYIEGEGLTLFKTISEYLISIILLSSIALLLAYRDEIDRLVLRWIIWSIICTIFSELAFTFYVDPYGLLNLIGHYFKILSFWCIYKALIETALKKPYNLLFRELKQSEQRYQSLFTYMINGFAYHKVIFDTAGNPVDYVFLEVNDAFEKLTGLNKTDIAGKRVTEVLPGIQKNPGNWIGRYGKVALTGGWDRFEEYEPILDRWYSVIVYSHEKGYFVTVFEDITQRKQAEETLKKTKENLETIFKEQTVELFRTNELLQTIIDHIPAMLFICDSSDNVKLINKEFERLTGWHFEEAEAMDLIKVCHPEPGIGEEMWLYLKEARPGWRDFLLKTREGKQLDISWASVRLSDGSILGIGIDITERKRTEERLASYMEQLERSNKELQEFAFVASHDLQEPLRKIRTFGEMLISKFDNSLGETGRDYIGRMQKASMRMQRLIDSLLTYSRISTKANPFSNVNLNEAVKDALANLEIRISETNASVDLNELPTIEADSEQMIQLFQNLLANALKFCRNDEPARIRIYSHEAKKDTFHKSRAYVIYIEDNGIGFEEKYIDRIFNPFQKLHGRDLYEGEGMGLAICKKIVMRHKGSITAKSVLTKGSIFIITLLERQV
jgi:PAS domain S-box-containing protein